MESTGRTIKDLLNQLAGVPIDLGGVVYPNDFAEDLFIDRTDLQNEFLTHAEKYAYYATLAELAEDRHTRLKENLDAIEARIDYEKRTQYAQIKSEDGKFKMTEKMFANEVLLDSRYQTALKELQDARYLAKVLRNAPMAFAHRRDMLLEIGRSHVVGMSDPRIIEGQQESVRAILQRNKETAPSLPSTETTPITGRRAPKARV